MASASAVTMFSYNAIEIEVMVTSLQSQWKQVQLRFAWSDGSEMACFAYDRAVVSMDKLETDRSYNMIIPGACVKPVQDPSKSGVNNAKEIHLNKPIQWSLTKAHLPT